MAGRFDYTDPRGVRKHEDLDDAQCVIDGAAVRHFEGLEGAVALGAKVSDGGEFRPAVQALREAVMKLPPMRAAHWVAECKRLGLDVAPSPPPPPKAKTSTTGG